jgi:4-hydroxymandelate oxidase
VGMVEAKWRRRMSRRKAMASLAGVVAGSPLFGATLEAQQDPRPLREHTRLPGFDEMTSSFDFEPLMFANVPLSTYDYTAHGDGSEFTLRRNRQAFEWVSLLPGRPIDPKSVDLATEVLGAKMKYPIIVAPSALQAALHPDGEVGMRRGATGASTTPMILSANTSTPVEKVAADRGGPLWAQFYPQRDTDTGKELLDRMQGAGCTAVVITVDQQGSYYERTAQDVNLGGSPRTARGGGARGGGARAGGPAPAATLTGPARYRLGTGRLWYTWQYLDDIRKLIKVPMLIKGILTAEDARVCVEHGMDGIIVSNHGGRSMDYGPSTLEVLPEIVAAVNGRVPIITDSGYRRGTDILKALALGAQAVMLGRTTRWALGAFGAPGVQRLLEMLQTELVAAAAAAGCSTLKSIDARIVKTNFT